MKRSHALAISLVVAVAIVAAGFAAVRTAGLGAASAKPVAADGAIAKKKAQLDRYEKKLKAALANKPPKLPTLEKRSRATASGGRVVYVQAPAPAVTTSSGGGEPEDHYEGNDDDHAEASEGGEHDD